MKWWNKAHFEKGRNDWRKESIFDVAATVIALALRRRFLHIHILKSVIPRIPYNKIINKRYDWILTFLYTFIIFLFFFPIKLIWNSKLVLIYFYILFLTRYISYQYSSIFTFARSRVYWTLYICMYVHTYRFLHVSSAHVPYLSP